MHSKEKLPAALGTVRVTVIIPKDAEPFSEAVLRVRLEESTHAGARASTVDDIEIRCIAHLAGERTAIAALLRATVDAQSRYTVRAYLDLDGIEGIAADDYVSVESHPVLTFGYPDSVEVPLRQARQ